MNAGVISALVGSNAPAVAPEAFPDDCDGPVYTPPVYDELVFVTSPDTFTNAAAPGAVCAVLLNFTPGTDPTSYTCWYPPDAFLM